MSQKHGKNYRAALEKVEKGRLYAPLEAVELVRDTASGRFDSTVEAHLRLGIFGLFSGLVTLARKSYGLTQPRLDELKATLRVINKFRATRCQL